MRRFENRNVMITGAASGIGKAAAVRIASEGANLALLDIDFNKLRETAEQLSQYGTKIVFAKCDVSDFDEVGICINKLCQDLGGIQSLSHNAGILRCYNTHEMTFEEWNKIISVNLTGMFNVNRHALPHLLKNKNSYLVNTSSNAVTHCHPWLAAYAATKGGITSFTISLYIEYCLQGLHANCVLPGSVSTSLYNSFTIPKGANPEVLKCMNPLGKPPVSGESVAATIAFLASDDAMHINGTSIYADGGSL